MTDDRIEVRRRGLTILFVTSITQFSCNSSSLQQENKAVAVKDSLKQVHGYNELADPEKIGHFTISDYNTDNPDIKNIERPDSCIIQTSIDTSLLFSIWVKDPEGPHADFSISSSEFYVVDYDGDGSMPYSLTGDKLKVYYNDFVQQGTIVSVHKDSLLITWKDMDETTKYLPWKN